MLSFVGPLLALTVKPPPLPETANAASSGVAKYDLIPRCPLPQLHLLKSAEVLPPMKWFQVARAVFTTLAPNRYVLPNVMRLFLPLVPLSVARRFPLRSKPTGCTRVSRSHRPNSEW